MKTTTATSRRFPDRRVSVAPMMGWTDRHDRYFMRLITPHALLYTVMITTGALTYGKKFEVLDFSEQEHPLALQLGGSDPAEMAACTKLAKQWGYDEVNINCGCPSERVQRGAFGACLMAEPALVADGVKAMVDAVSLPVTVKHRIGIDKNEDYGFVRDFVGTVSEAGCAVFMVHARNAWLQGLSPKENREIPPLRYDLVHQLKRDRPDLTIEINGGLETLGDCLSQLQVVDGAMVGRAAYHHPLRWAGVDHDVFNDSSAVKAKASTVVRGLMTYADNWRRRGDRLWPIARHLVHVVEGVAGARAWRQQLTQAAGQRDAGAEVLDAAARQLEAHGY